MNEPRTFAEWLTWTREEHGYSKNALAQASGVDRSHLFKMEKGTITEPADDTRQKLHAVFGTSDDDLVRLGLMTRREYPRASGSVTVYEYAQRPLIPPAQQPGASAGDDPMLAEVLRIWPMLGEPERRVILTTAQMAERAITQERSRAGSPQRSPALTDTAPDPLKRG